MSATTRLQFGIEIELLLGGFAKTAFGGKKPHTSWKALAQDLHVQLLAAGIANHISQECNKDVELYDEWSIVPEVTIPTDPRNNLFGVELVSPILQADGHWALDLDVIFHILSSKFKLAPSSKCSTHIHVSGTPVFLTPLELGDLAKAALYFEHALDALVPSCRRGSSTHWCRRNRDNALLSGRDPLDTLHIIEDACVLGLSPLATSSDHGNNQTISLVEAMNIYPPDEKFAKIHNIKKHPIHGKMYKWNFQGMLPPTSFEPLGGRGTVEYRQPPGSMSAQDAKGWVVLVLGFVTAATSAGYMTILLSSGAAGEVCKKGGDVDELKEMVKSGVKILGLGKEDAAAVRKIWKGAGKK